MSVCGLNSKFLVIYLKNYVITIFQLLAKSCIWTRNFYINVGRLQSSLNSIQKLISCLAVCSGSVC